MAALSYPIVSTAVFILSYAVWILNSKSAIDTSQSTSLSAYKSSSAFYYETRSPLISAKRAAIS